MDAAPGHWLMARTQTATLIADGGRNLIVFAFNLAESPLSYP
jgi:hypothetical protein